ncbi:putative pectin lyase [Lophium mytilinum]|uniref:pectin lyase n=1 Tax=Lophium mytilinum TaxID=390894 RepID=A0A6A6QUH8_9PEZI|nr:putative pectin lyase [Lophium mytilinum]
MRFFIISLLAFSGYARSVEAVGVVGSPVGFAVGTTGGGSATPQYPADIAQLTAWLTDNVPRVIVLDRTYDYAGSEGTVTGAGCRPSSNTCPGHGGQDAINANNWCDESYPKISVTYDKAATQGINVGSNKSIIGDGKKGVIRGKGLRIANGAQNVIIQNIHITHLNPRYIWGGDAITLAGTDLVWIDHVKISHIGRQHFVSGYAPSNRVTISNCDFDGSTRWSASCDGHHYWGMLLLGSSDQITLAGNYMHHMSSRSPKVGGNTLLHAVNNLFADNTGHAFDILAGGQVVAEGNVFESVKTTLMEPVQGLVFTSPNAAMNARCKPYLGHDCAKNLLQNSGNFNGDATGMLAKFSDYHSPPALSDTAVKTNVLANAGVGKIGRRRRVRTAHSKI